MGNGIATRRLPVVLTLLLLVAAPLVSAERTGPMSAFFARFALAVERGEPETHALLEEALGAWLPDGTHPPSITCASPVCLAPGSPCDPDSTDRVCTVDTCLPPFFLSQTNPFSLTHARFAHTHTHSLPCATRD